MFPHSYIINLRCLITVDGGWGSWTNWSLCSATCGDGHRSRQRFCNNSVPAGSGNNCSGSNTERETCNITEFPGISHTLN